MALIIIIYSTCQKNRGFCAAFFVKTHINVKCKVVYKAKENFVKNFWLTGKTDFSVFLVQTCTACHQLSSAKKKLSDTQFELVKVQNDYILKKASEEKLEEDLDKELQNTPKVTVDLKEFQNKAKHVETLESAVEVKDKALNNLKLLHDKLKEKLKESTCKLRANTKSTAKFNEKLERKNEKIEKLKAKEVEQKNTIKGNMKEIQALNFENQLLHKSLSSEKEYIKN